MSQLHLIISEKQVAKMRTLFKGVLVITLLILGGTGFRYLTAKMRTADLADQVRMQRNTLKNLRESIKSHPVESAEVKSLRGNSIAGLQAELERAARTAHCTVTEFQASPDRAPYISVFTLDTNWKAWEQVPIHVSLKGSLTATLATVASLAKCGIPLEPDSLEISRQSISEQGAAEVVVRLDLRALIQAGGKA